MRIICASAGTGKTHRLSLEYLAIVLQYYGKAEFNLDSILALTFTRKATAEIRQRIVAQLSLLTGKEPKDQKERESLMQNLRQLVPAETPLLTQAELNALLSARHEIICDASRMQVMTIDSYISHIFRNIVRPLRNIETYEIDTEAIRKRMPYLLNHLMKPEFRIRLNRLLSRKVNRSLDTYTSFFTSLIKLRWLYYMITKRLSSELQTENPRLLSLATQGNLQNHQAAFLDAMQTIIETISGICSTENKAQLPDYFNKAFSDLIVLDAKSPAAIMKNLENLSSSKALSLLSILDEHFWNKKKISEKKYPNDSEILHTNLRIARQNLADHLMLNLYLPEQQEILELWQIILTEYDRLIYRYKNMTYDDISWFSFEALFSSDPPFLEPESAVSATEFYQFLSHRTRFLLIDEFQDTSLIQFNILKPIIEELTAGEGSKPFGGLVVVGDEKQSIFGWRGGQRDLLLNLQGIFPSLGEVQTERLERSWRCGPTVMQFINSVFMQPNVHNYLAGKGMSWQYQMISSASVKNEPGALVELCLRNYSTAGAEQSNSQEMFADFVQRMVVPALQDDPTGSIAILCRKGKELEGIQQALDDSDVSSLYQPDRSLAEHSYLNPLLSWLRFVAWGDYTDFVAFLRSDYLRINTALLKETLKRIRDGKYPADGTSAATNTVAADILSAVKPPNIVAADILSATQPDFSGLPLVHTLHALAKSQTEKSPTEICRTMMDTCLGSKILGQRDYLNLHRWLDILVAWEIGQAEKGSSIPDLLQFISENYATDALKQVSISSTDSLQLLTIHKSKGLQFKRVFVFYNLSSGHRDDSSVLKWAVQYADKDFHLVSDFGISYHYEKVLKASSYAHLWTNEQNRERLEEMNNLYVAFTRAETKLHLYFCYRGKDDWNTYFTAHTENNLPLQICNAALLAMQACPMDERGIYQLVGQFPAAITKPVAIEPAPAPVILDHLSALQKVVHHKTILPDSLKENDATTNHELKKIWLIDRPNLIGDLLHYYLSFIIRNTRAEHDYALMRCLRKFGGILTAKEISEHSTRCVQTCQANPWLFTSGWDKIFTEQELLYKGGLCRLDRLLLNTADKEALIVDYKSGEVHDSDQLSTYAKALSTLKAMQGYHIESRILFL